jgi:iron complex transport system ATP-binding protein
VSTEEKSGLAGRRRGRSGGAPVLNVSRLTVRRGPVTILREVNWRVEAGQHWVVLGANGSGKTSLLSSITGFLPPSAGELSVLNCRYGASDWRELRRHVGLVSSSIRQMMADSESALETVVSGRYAMIDFWGRMTPSDRRRAEKILVQVECRDLADRPWLYLSQGERQRVLIGRALMASPRLLILDEPCAGLDPLAREHFLQFLQRLGRRREAPTLVFVTHHVEEILPVFTHVLVLRRGTVLAAGRRSAVLTSNVLSAAFDCAVKLSKVQRRHCLAVRPACRRIV